MTARTDERGAVGGPVTSPWTDEEIAQQFRLEVQQRFAAENAEHLRLEREEIVEVKAKYDVQGRAYPDWLAERDSFLWEIYSSSVIQIEANSVKVTVAQGFAIYADFIEMFGGTSVGWGLPSVGAEIIDGEPRVTIKLILVDSWDEDWHAAWLAKKAPAA